MNYSFKAVVLTALCAASISGCDESNSGANSECSKTCGAGEVCADGVCKCGEAVCKDGEVCKDSRCVEDQKDPAPTDKCDPACKDNQECKGGTCVDTTDDPVDTCDGRCSGDETCVDGTCKCGDEVCGDGRECVEGACSTVIVPDACNESCRLGETCVEGVCKCGSETCTGSQICNEGKCEYACEGDGCEVIVCDPECGDGQSCIDGSCVDVVLCDPTCGENEVCVSGKCEEVKVDPCMDVSCEGDSVCAVDGDKAKCLCGSGGCTSEQTCYEGKCEWIDPCHDVKCGTNEVCVEGKCGPDIVPNPTSLDVMLSTLSTLTVKSSSTLTWKLNKAANNQLLCKVSGKNEYVSADNITKCIVQDKTNKTESVSFTSRERKLDNYIITLSDAANNSVKVTLTMKPYFGYDNFMVVHKGDVFPAGLTYRNCLCPGYKFFDKYDKNKENDDAVANLGGKSNSYGKKIFTSEEVAVIDKDMYNKYVKPNLLDGQYGTRASVLAAARFLILQFPYDIPYFINTGKNLGASHYIWSDYEGDKADKLEKVAVKGLNLDTNMYNSHTSHKSANVINDSAIQAWGDVATRIYINKAWRNGDAAKHEFAGLECSGYVTWAFRNGLLALGDWTTHIFGNDKHCFDHDGVGTSVKNDKSIRNYRCADIANGTRKGVGTLTPNNALNGTAKKLGMLKDSDFIALNEGGTKIHLSDLKTKLKSVKAGDLLWNGDWVANSNHKYYSSGHVAMIIGIKRDKDGYVSEMYVGEAVHRNGNKLSKYKNVNSLDSTVNEFYKSSWVSNDDRAGFIIKMDNVYNYYSSTKGIEVKDNVNDCKKSDANGGNCYNYKEMYDEAFNSAIKVVTLKK